MEATRAWLIDQGLRDRSPERLLDGFSRRLLELGVPVARVHVTLKSIHPTFGAVSHRWYRDRPPEHEAFDRDAIPRWHESPLYHMLVNRISELRLGPPAAGEPDPFPILQELWSSGGTDYYATRFMFGDPDNARQIDPENPPEGIFVTFTSDAPDGFTDRDVADLRALLPTLAVSLKSGVTRQMARDLLDAYLGPDAGGRVMSGAIARGSSERLSAVILCFDLTGFTRLSHKVPGEGLITMLNAYFSVTVGAVEAHGGNVLKFMGDGLLAVFTQEGTTEARRAAVGAVRAIRAGMAGINAARRREGLPATDCTMALHAGDVLYGNIGAPKRLDFTVIGPAVNTAARLLEMCGQVDQQIVISDRVAHPLRGEDADLVSLGHYRMRGVVNRYELFTLE